LFLALVIWSFYFARSGKWLLASLLGLLASATRVVGIILFPVLLIEFILQRRNKKDKPRILLSLCLLLIPLGLVAYMFYLKNTTGDFLAFINSLSSFGEQRSAIPVVLPQVFYRYLFKILPNLNYTYFPQVFTTFLELILSLLFGVVAVISLFKLRLSYTLYLIGAYLLSTISGSFSSFPRYALVLFPAFIIYGVWLAKKTKAIRTVFYIISFSLLVVSLALFFRGNWLA
jgi:hypothetical protein